MKKLIQITIVFILIFWFGNSNSQTINWFNLKKEERHIVNLNAGLEYCYAFGIGYGYQFRAFKMPVIANIEFSIPSGDNLIDDFKSKAGFEIRWFNFHGIQFSTNVHGVFRRYENDMVRLVNFGSDFSGIIGLYRPKWFVAGEAGFDKAILTHFKHSEIYRNQFPEVVNGWYEPATGGNFYYGLHAGYSFKKQDIYLRAGKLINEDFKTSPTVSVYAQIGCNFKF